MTEKYHGSMFLRMKRLFNFILPAVVFAMLAIMRFETRSEGDIPYGLIGLVAFITVMLVAGLVIYLACRNEYIELGPDYILYHDGKQQARFFLREVTRLARVSIPLVKSKSVSCFRIESGPDHFLFGNTGGLYEEAFPPELRSRGGKNRIVIDVQETDDLVGRLIERAGLVQAGEGEWGPSGSPRFSPSSTADYERKEPALISGREMAVSVILCLLLFMGIRTLIIFLFPKEMPDENTFGYTSASILDSVEFTAMTGFAVVFPVFSMLVFMVLQRSIIRESWLRPVGWAVFSGLFLLMAGVTGGIIYSYSPSLLVVLEEKDLMVRNLPGMEEDEEAKVGYKDIESLSLRDISSGPLECWADEGFRCGLPADVGAGLRQGMQVAAGGEGWWIPAGIEGFERLKQEIIARGDLRRIETQRPEGQKEV